MLCMPGPQVDASGWVAIVHEPWGVYRTRKPSFGTGSGEQFKVAWHDDRFPSVANGCAGGACTVSGELCLCDVVVSHEAVFHGSSPPSRVAVEARLRLGAFSIDLDTGASLAGPYVRIACTSTECDGADDVAVWRRGATQAAPSSGAPVALDESSVLCVVATGACYVNAESTVAVGSSSSFANGHLANNSFAFRNAPHFVSIACATCNLFAIRLGLARPRSQVSFTEPRAIDAAYETEALLDHLFAHQNVPSFVSHLLIQRFISSNPTPRYVRAVATAFKSGNLALPSGATIGSGQRGDLGATIAAVLLDREARSPAAAADPAAGVLREPLLKVIQLMRALSFTPKPGLEVELNGIEADIGMNAHKSPSVFKCVPQNLYHTRCPQDVSIPPMPYSCPPPAQITNSIPAHPCPRLPRCMCVPPRGPTASTNLITSHPAELRTLDSSRLRRGWQQRPF